MLIIKNSSTAYNHICVHPEHIIMEQLKVNITVVRLKADYKNGVQKISPLSKSLGFGLVPERD